MRIMQFQGATALEYGSQSIRAIYDSNHPNTPFWLTSDICKVLNINESWLTPRSFPKKYKAVIRGITRSKKVIDFECMTTEGLLHLTNKPTRTPEIEKFANGLESTALPEIKQQGDKIVKDFVTIPANKEITKIEVSAIVPTVNTTRLESNSEITFSNQQEHFTNIIIEKEHLIQENLYLKSQLEDYISRLYDTEMRLEEVGSPVVSMLNL